MTTNAILMGHLNIFLFLYSDVHCTTSSGLNGGEFMHLIQTLAQSLCEQQ
jgi:hypothetical protein